MFIVFSSSKFKKIKTIEDNFLWVGGDCNLTEISLKSELFSSLFECKTLLSILWNVMAMHLFGIKRSLYPTWSYECEIIVASVEKNTRCSEQLCYTFKAFSVCAYRLLLWRNRMLRQSATNGSKYRVRQIVHKTTRTYINSRTLQAAGFSQFKVNKKQKKIIFSIENQHWFGSHIHFHCTSSSIYTCNFIDSIM